MADGWRTRLDVPLNRDEVISFTDASEGDARIHRRLPVASGLHPFQKKKKEKKTKNNNNQITLTAIQQRKPEHDVNNSSKLTGSKMEALDQPWIPINQLQIEWKRFPQAIIEY